MPAASQITTQAGFLSGAVIERELAGHAANHRPKIIRAIPAARFNDCAAIVADHVHGDNTGTARAG